jgi:CBS domain-containing protein
MKLGSLLAPERIRVPLRARSVSGGFEELRGLLAPEAPGERLAGSHTTSPTGRSALMVVPGGEVPGDAAIAVGVAPHPLEGRGGDGSGQLRILVLVGGRGLGREARYRLEAAFFDPDVEEALIRAGSAAQVLGLRRLTELELQRPLRVEDVMEPLSYRIYPDTPLREVLDLMVRRKLRAVPVVGQGLQVLGVLTQSDVLRHGLQARGKAGGKGSGLDEGGPTAREIMTRAVMCVSEDQPLSDAAQLMSNRNVAQLPVIREGEIVGFLTREGVLSALFGEVGQPSGTTGIREEKDR